MIYFTTNSDGNHTEGIGAMAQYQIICLILSKLYNVGFYFTGFKNLTHHQYFNINNKDWDDGITKFFNFPITEVNLPIVKLSEINSDLESFINNKRDLILYIESNYLMSFIDQYINEESVRFYLSQLKNNIQIEEFLKYFNKEKENVSIHIRKYTKTDCDLNPRREYFTEEKKDYYINIIQHLNNKNREFHIYSQGKEDDFNFLKKENVILHIEENPLVSLYHMTNSDILFTSNSSLSYVAHLLGHHKQCFVRSNFFHKWKKECNFI
jgi:hypothetical protein